MHFLQGLQSSPHANRDLGVLLQRLKEMANELLLAKRIALGVAVFFVAGFHFGKQALTPRVVVHAIRQGDLRQKAFKHLRIGQGAQTLVIDAHRPGLLHHRIELIDQTHLDPALGQQMGEQQTRGPSAHHHHWPHRLVLRWRFELEFELGLELGREFGSL